MDYARLETELPLLFAELLGIPCDWRKRPRKQHTDACAQLDVISNASIGGDERAWVDVDSDADTVVDSIQATVYGVRELVVQVSVWSPVQSLATSARAYLERLRTRLSLPSSLDAIKALELALVGVEDLVLTDPDQDGRTRSEASIDVRFAYGHDETEAAAIPFLETVRVTSSSARDVQGDPLGAALQIDINPPGA